MTKPTLNPTTKTVEKFVNKIIVNIHNIVDKVIYCNIIIVVVRLKKKMLTKFDKARSSFKTSGTVLK